MILVALLVILAVITAVDEWDRRSRPRRFGVGLRRSHLHGDVRRPWRWRVFPLYLPGEADAIDVALGYRSTDLPTSGRARTYLGALFAGCRARHHLEDQLAAERAEFVAGLTRPDRRPIFPAETSQRDAHR